MARTEQLTYNGYVIGGSASAQILDRFGFDEDESAEACAADFVCRFVIRGTSYGDLATKRQTLEDALRTPNCRLELMWSTSKLLVFDPDVSASDFPASGFNAAPRLSQIDGPVSTGLTVGYEFRVKVGLPPNYTGAAGRRTAHVNYHYDTDERPVIRITGAYTPIPTKAARLAYLAAIDAFALARVQLVDNVGSYTIVRRDEEDDNFQNALNFVREYALHVHGRRAARREVTTLPSGARVVNYSVSYLRTINMATLVNVAASTNYADATNGGEAFVTADLQTLTPPLYLFGTGGTPNAEIIGRKVVPNEQDDRVDATLVARELLWQQSGAASGLEDPQILVDNVVFAVSYQPTDDSPVPSTANGPLGGALASPANPALPDPGASRPGTVGRPAPGVPSPANQTNKNTVAGGGSSTPAQKPIDLFFYYQATIRSDVTDLKAKYEGAIRPYLLNEFAALLGFSALVLVGDEFKPNPTDNTIAAVVHGQAIEGAVLALSVTDTDTSELGLRLDGVLNGELHNYMIQQGFARITRQRKIAVVRKTGSPVDLSQFAYKTAIPGFVVVRETRPDRKDRVVGIAGRSLGQVGLTSEGLVQDLVYVAKAVGGSAAPPNGAVVSSGSTISPPDANAVLTGKS